MGVLNKPLPLFWIVALAVVSSLPLIQGQTPPQPTSIKVVTLGKRVLDFSWDAVTGDFDKYLILLYENAQTPQEVQIPVEVDKSLTKHRYDKKGRNINGITFFTLKGTTRSAARAPAAGDISTVNIAVPTPTAISETSSTLKVSWLTAPDPTFDIGEYEITLQYPVGTDIQTMRVAAVAGATHTFEGLQSGSEYAVRIRAFHPEQILIETDNEIIAVLWTLPHAPSNGLIYQTSATTATLTWTAANQPFDYYNLIVTPLAEEQRVYKITPESTSFRLDNILAGVQYSARLQSVVNTPNHPEHQTVESAAAVIQEVYPSLDLNLKLDAITDHGMHLTWDQNANNQLQKYTITTVDANGNSAVTEDIPPGATSYTIPNLPSSGAIYEYILNAYFGGVLQYAGSTIGTTKTPVNVELNSITTNTATITWDKSVFPNPDNYLVNVISMDGTYTALLPVQLNEAVGAYTITGLPAGKRYQIGVDAVKNGIRMEVGAIQQPVTLDTSIKTDVVTTDLIQTSWNIIEGGTYTLLLTNLADGTTRPVEISNSQTNKYVFTGLTPGQKYSIQLTGHLNGQNVDGGTVSETTIPLPPKDIQVTQSASGTDTIVTWKPPDNVYDGFSIVGGGVQTVLGREQTQHTFPNFVDDGSNLILVSTSQDKFSLPGLPITNYNVQLGGATPTSLQVSYNQFEGATGYHILLYNKDGTVQAEQVINGAVNTPHTFNGLNPSTEYTAVVSATNNDQKLFMGTDTASTANAVQYDYKLNINPVTTETMGITWNHNPDANFDTYRLTVADAAGNFPAKTYTIPANGNPNQLVTGLIPGTEYSVDVSGVANGIQTTVASARQSTVPEPPAITFMTQTDDKIALNWLGPQQGTVDNYIIKYGPYGGTLQQVVLAPHIQEYTIPQPLDNSQQHKVEIYSSIGSTQQLISDKGIIQPNGVPPTINPTCNPNPCLNNGVCRIEPTVGFVCTCTGFTGNICQTAIIVDFCDQHNCINGICISGTAGFTCDCIGTDFTGTRCETRINNCVAGICQNGGACQDDVTRPGEYICTCTPGYLGKNCETDINECTSAPCLNNGVCLNQVNRYTCDCANLDFTGTNCETPIDACSPTNPCQNDGVCTDGIGLGVFSCACKPGFTGATCTNDPNDCDSNPCLNGGICIDGIANYVCFCDATDFNGLHCENRIDDCSPTNPCKNNGACMDGTTRGAFTCQCTAGFSGPTCENVVNFCLQHNCINGGVCVSGATSFTCNCVGTDFTGAQCETRVDNCVIGICQNGGVCRDDLTRVGEYICTCLAGYTGKNCETNTNECASTPCLNNGVCTDRVNRFTCDCSLIDYIGVICGEKVDNCKPFNPCQNGGICTDGTAPGTFLCTCLPGFFGSTCTNDNNECNSSPCQNGGICTDGVNRYTCDCALIDYTGTLCETKINDCQPTNPCQNNGICTDGTVRGDFSCRCVAGYTGPTCTTNINECASGPCQNNGKCNDGVNSYSCDCSGTDFEGNRCETRINDCPSNNPCQNGGTCVDGTSPKVYSCNCLPGFTGFYCNNQPNECDSNPCLNGGACQDGTNRFTCVCVGTDYTGVQCETKINDCASFPCINGGACVDGIISYTCNCAPGYQGTNCENNFDECISRPCLNSGTCNDMVNGYGCTCASGFLGPNCAININECNSNPCQNGGTCVDGFNRYTCVCFPNFSGLRCETNTNQCINSLCSVNSVCIDGVNTFTCRCFPGYEGIYCNQEINECMSSPCQNGGTCVDALLHYTCRCTEMFQGQHCEISMSSNVVITSMEPTRIRGVFNDIMPTNPDAVYEVSVLDSQGIVKETKLFRRPDIVNGMISFDFDTLQPGTDYKVRLSVTNDGQVFPLDTLNVRTSTICTTNVCNNGGTCREDATAPLGYLCTCAAGYDGPTCTNDINECASNPCSNSGHCRNLLNLFECVCTSQWKGPLCTIPVTVNFVTGQTTPQSIQVIWNQPVGTVIPKYEVILTESNGAVVSTGTVSQDEINNGVFDFIFHAPKPGTNYISQLYALMDDGTRVPLASITPSSAQICTTRPCENNGVCVDNGATSLGYTCNCRPGYTGDNCQTDINECMSNPCKNNGQCINGINAFSCSCAIGWMGPLCTIPSSIGFSVGEVTTSTVQVRWPNIPMEPGTNFYYKIQVTDAAGQTQSQNIQPVPNAGPNYINNYVIPNLLPSTPYEVSLIVVTDNQEHTVGTQVPTTKSVCTELLPCQNGGICIIRPTLVERYSCICPDGWTGLNCDKDVLECQSSPCQNGGQCLERFQGYTCQCSTQYQGIHCQVATSNMLTVAGMTSTDVQFTFTPLNNNDVLIYYLTLRDDVTQLEKTQALTPEQVQNGVIDQAFFGLTPNNKYTAALNVQMAGETALLNLGQREITTPNACVSITCLNNGVCVPGTNPPLFYTCTCLPGFTGPLCAGDENNCAGNPCANGGQCVDRQGSYVCNCANGFNGQNCEININECISNPCSNRGRCVDDVNGFTCNCFPGFTGTFCTTAINECASEPCQNGGLCNDDTNRFFCVCSPGYTGVYCQQNMDECASNPCLNNAACIDQVNRFICTCQVGFFGATCGDAFDTCASNPCLYGGICRDQQSSFTCSCPTGYSGLRCEVAPNACDSNPCTNGGTCISMSNSYFCLCLARWQGLNCQLAVSPCENRPCRNGGTCVASTTGFRCDCRSGYTGEICDINIDDCASSPCQERGACMDQLNGYVCICFSSYTGTNCLTDMSACNSNPCQNDGFCLSTGSQYYCVCTVMWTGQTCDQSRDQLECASNPCLNGGTCLEQFSGYNCMCAPGFTGTSCESDVNECVNFNLCQNGGTCINSIGSYQCACVVGYEGPTCQILLFRCTVGYCMNGGICQEQSNTRTCSCFTGFQGTRCEIQINFCAGVICQNGGQCVTASNTYNCQCQPGYGGNLCQINIDNCSPNPCQNGGQCQDGVNTAICICPNGYTGNTCLININECLTPNLCLNGGTCVDGLATYSCRCVAGYTGNRCHIDVPECASNPCQNNGVCIEQLNMYLCQCQVGYQGNNCEIQININECSSNPCLNNGQCLDGQNLYTCQCTPGFIGTRCLTNLNECASSPCQNLGRCVDNVNSFSCICQGGYTGPRCTIGPCTSHQCQNGGQCVVSATPNNLGYSCICPSTHIGSFCQTLIDVDLCRPLNPCMNSGNCVDGVNTYNCVCLPGYGGRICETNINECASRPCQNSGTCTDAVNNFVCQCLGQFTGLQCETRIYTPCQPNPCLNFGICNVFSATLNIHTCRCVQGYTGSRCETPPPNLCQRSPCQNGGTCIPQGTTAYRCACLSFYTGQNCDISFPIDPCTSNPCLYGGQCNRASSGPVVYYTCTCFNGYVGQNCETRPNPCVSNPCLNGGQCSLNNNNNNNNNNFGYFCNCVNGFTGANCQTANPCISNPCVNGGTCRTQSFSGVMIYVCQCIVGYTGERCSVPPQNPCNSRPCLNGGQCSRNLQDVTAYFCTCSANYYGNRCELRNDPCVSNPCLNGGRCTSQQNGNTFIYLCQCLSGYTGIQCGIPPSNPCISQPCQNGGRCNRISNFQFTCQCPQAYTGTFCQTSTVTPCTVNPCTNGGTCYDLSTGFTCVCRPGYSGSTCLYLTACASNPCQNGGTCSQMQTNQNQYRCTCQFGWTGTNCELTLPTDCTNNPCLNQGICIVTGTSSYMCNCRNGFTGIVCNIIVVCNPNPCLNGGQCSTAANNIFNPICTCTQSYTGNRCQIALTTPCSNSPCLNGGTCTSTGTSSYMCSCPAGYMGANCQSVGACNPSPCVNGGTCMINFNNPADFFCDCFTGYTGNTCQFASPTPCSSNPCQNGGACSNTANSRYTCQCRTGYSGTRCATIVACASNPCQNNGLCTINSINPNQFVCSCQPNFSGTFCQTFVRPVTVCTVNPCLNGGACIQDAAVNTGYRCQCTSGYMGTNCNVQITLCSQPCVNGGGCVFDQTHSVYTCSCSEQFAGTQCQISSTCSADYVLAEGQEIQITSPNYPNNYFDNLNCLYNIKASSTDRRVSFIINDMETECDQDLVNIGHGTNPANTASIVMRESGTGLIAPFFIDDSNAWLMFKSDKWQTGKGFSITVKDVPLAGAVVTQCDAGRCANGGMCVIRGDQGSVYCVCRAGYNGDRCETNVDECSSTPCQFGGECRDVINGYICICTGGRQGPNCESATSSQCQGSMCFNGGTCHAVIDGSYVCSCPLGYTGVNCQQVGTSRSCQSNPCFNRGQCVDVADGTFLCICTQTYSGTQCEVGAQDCICQNGGICFGANNCICSKGFTGQFCEVNINECLSRPCLNGGRCVNGENFFSCICLTGYSGLTCRLTDPNISRLSSNGDGTNTAASTGQTLGIGWIILISVLALLLLLLLVFIALRSWKSYDNRYYEDKNHLTDYEENNRFTDSQPREMEMGNILLPQTGATNVTHLNAREEPWPVSTDEMPTSNI